MHPTHLAALAVACSLLLAPADVRAQAPERFRVTGSRIAIYNLVGAVQVEAGTGTDVVVEVTRGGAAGARLRIETGPIGREQTLRVIYPERKLGYPLMHGQDRTMFRVRDDGTFGDGEDDDGDRFTVSGSGGGLEAWANLRILLPAGRTAGVYLGVGEVRLSGVEGDLRIDAAAADITASSMQGTLDLDTGSGDIEVKGMDGDLRVDTGSGSVKVAGMRGTALEIDTGSGEVAVDGLTADGVKIDTGSGDVRLGAVKSPRIGIETGSGTVRLELLTDVDNLSVETGSGDVLLTLAAAVGAGMHLETSSGNLDVDFPVTIRRRANDELTGTIGDGRGSISIETGSGDVTLRRR